MHDDVFKLQSMVSPCMHALSLMVSNFMKFVENMFAYLDCQAAFNWNASSVPTQQTTSALNNTTRHQNCRIPRTKMM